MTGVSSGAAGASGVGVDLSGETGVFLASLVLPPGVVQAPTSQSKEQKYGKVKRTELEKLCDELSDPKNLGRPIELLKTYGTFGVDDLIRLMASDPVDPKIFTPDVAQRLIGGGLLPLLERKKEGAAAATSEIVIGIRAQSRDDGKLKHSSALTLPILDGFLPWAKSKGIDHRVVFVLLAGDDFQLLERLRVDEEARRKFLRELDPEKSARTTFMEVLEKAISKGASDIHIEPLTTKEARIRYRVDGVLVEDPTLIKPAYATELVNVIKVTAEIDITEKRRPQDGSITFKKEEQLRSFLRDNERTSLTSAELQERFKFLEGKSLRISTLPTPHGESCAIRILQSADSARFRLSDVGFPKETLAKLRTLLGAPNGVVLVAGPTGSGKTTTLAGCLMELNSPDVKIVTVEDPVEQEQRGVTQTQVRTDIGYKFSDALRSILRHDPDIVLVGEVRDAETAQIMIQGANTGHLMLSTIHTNDSISVLKRLRDLGVEEFQIQDSLLGVLSQRLARKLCSGCKVAYDARADLNALFGEKLFDVPRESRADSIQDPDAVVMYKPGSREKVCQCKACGGKGYKGRVAVPELWVIGQDEKDLISQGEHGHKVYYEAAVRNGMTPMSLQGFSYALQGITDIEELKSQVLRPDELILRKEMFREFFSRNTRRSRST